MSVIYDLNMKALKKADIDLYNLLLKTDAANFPVEISENGYPIPIYKNILLHDKKNPIEEARAFITSCDSLLENQDVLLVMGYAFGYHVDELFRRVQHDEHKFIFVIEPDLALFKKSLYYKDISSMLNKVTFIVAYEIEQLFAIPDFNRILNAAPDSIGFMPAIKINEEYFIDFVKRRSSNRVSHLLEAAEDNVELLNLLKQFPDKENVDLKKILQQILSKNNSLNKTEKIFLLMGELAS